MHQRERIGSRNRFSGLISSGCEGVADLGGRELPGWLDRCEAEAGVGVGSGSQSTGAGAEATHLVDVEPVLAGCFRGLGEHTVAASDDEPAEAAGGVVEVDLGEDCQFAAVLAGTDAALDPLGGKDEPGSGGEGVAAADDVLILG